MMILRINELQNYNVFRYHGNTHMLFFSGTEPALLLHHQGRESQISNGKQSRESKSKRPENSESAVLRSNRSFFHMASNR